MAVSVQNIYTGVMAIDTLSNLPLSITVSSGPDLALVMALAGEGDGVSGDTQVSTIDVNGDGGLGSSRLERSIPAGAAWSWSEVWGMLLPDAGTYDIEAFLDNPDRFGMACYVLEGVTAFGNVDEANGSAGTSSSLAFTGGAAGDLIIDSLGIDATGHSPIMASPGTEGHNTTISTAVTVCSGYQDYGDDTSPGWTWTTGAPFSHCGALVLQAEVIPPQILRPDADVTTTGWATAPLWSKIEESSPDDVIITGAFS